MKIRRLQDGFALNLRNTQSCRNMQNTRIIALIVLSLRNLHVNCFRQGVVAQKLVKTICTLSRRNLLDKKHSCKSPEKQFFLELVFPQVTF